MATDTAFWERQSDDMDFTCGPVLDGGSIEELGKQMFELMLATASGQRSRSESTATDKTNLRPGKSASRPDSVEPHHRRSSVHGSQRFRSVQNRYARVPVTNTEGGFRGLSRSPHPRVSLVGEGSLKGLGDRRLQPSAGRQPYRHARTSRSTTCVAPYRICAFPALIGL
jgi:hypothetical protein